MSLQYALKRGIETIYQVEPSELAVESLPTPKGSPTPDVLRVGRGGSGCFGAGGNRPRGDGACVARAALEVCHSNPSTGQDLRRATHAREDCEAACYDCLRSYSNTRYHEVLDRQLVKDVLLTLADCKTSTGAGSRTRAAQFSELRRTLNPWLVGQRSSSISSKNTGSDLQMKRRSTSPSHPANPDFYYRDAAACVFVDGRHHLYERRRASDANLDRRLREAGYEVIRFTMEEPWEVTAQAHQWVFGGDSK